MPLIQHGSCIGILYFSGSGTGACLNYDSGWVCVHNGKFNYAVYHSYKQKKYGKNPIEYHLNTPVPSGQMPDAICIGHWSSPQKQENKLFYGIADVHLTPDLHPPNNYACVNTRNQYQGTTDPNIIVPGNCVGIHFYDTNKGRDDIKNGRYLFWLDPQQIHQYQQYYPNYPPHYPHHCLINYNNTPSYNSIVYYYHYNIRYNPQTQLPEIFPEIRTRTNIKKVRKTIAGICQ